MIRPFFRGVNPEDEPSQATMSDLLAAAAPGRGGPAQGLVLDDMPTVTAPERPAAPGGTHASLPVHVQDLSMRVDDLLRAELRHEVTLVVQALAAGMVARHPTEMHAYVSELGVRVDALRNGKLSYADLTWAEPRPAPAAAAVVAPPTPPVEIEEPRTPRIDAPVRLLPRRPGPPMKGMRNMQRRKPKQWLVFYARHRRSLLLLLWALLGLLLLILLFWGWGRLSAYRTERHGRATLHQMIEAASYRSIGTDITTTPSSTTSITEDFSYVRPSQMKTSFTVLAGKIAQTSCRDLSIVVLGRERYQKCNDSANPTKWRSDTMTTNAFDLALVRPYMRLLWCMDIKVQDQTEVMDGVPMTVYTCRVKNEREASVVWDKSLPITSAGSQDRKRFVKEAKVHIKLWRRQDTGVVAKFYMLKTFPSNEGPATEEVTYTYFDFDKVPPIEKPS